MIKINVITNNDSWLYYIRKPNNYLDKKIDKLSIKKKEFKKNKIFCTLLLSGTKEIRHLNKKFRKKDKATDVLSFPFQTKEELKKKLKSKNTVYLGDIIINLNKIKYKNTKKKFEIEFDRLWIHGFVHLFGYDHKKEKDYKKMSLIEKEYFELIND
jgi:probable rRNA maturation factor